MSVSHLICALISENEGLEKSRSASNLRKISVPAHLNFFSVCHLNFFQIYGINFEKNSGDKLKKKIRCEGTEIFLRFETDLNFSRPSLSEIKVQIKWLINYLGYEIFFVRVGLRYSWKYVYDLNNQANL